MDTLKFIISLDQKINQNIKKKTHLKAYKKGMIQKIFSQETDKGGSRTPLKNNKKGEQLRFKDKNGKDFSDWEVKKLGEVANFYDEKRVPIKEGDRAKNMAFILIMALQELLILLMIIYLKVNTSC